MQRTLGDHAKSAAHFIFLSPIPPRLGLLSKEQNWKTIKDEIRRHAYMLDKDFKVWVENHKGHLFANCLFTKENDARDVFERIKGPPGYRFEGVLMQAWLYKLDQDGHNTKIDGPRDQVTGAILEFPAVLARFDPSIDRTRGSRGPFRPQSNQTQPPTHDMVVNRIGQTPNVSQDHVPTQNLPAISLTRHDSINIVGALQAPHPSPYVTNLSPYQQHLGHFSPSLGDTSELSDSSRTLFNTPELSSSSRNSSISAIPDTDFPARTSSYDTFHFISGGPYPNHNSSVSSTSDPYTPANSRNQSGSSYTFQDTASDEAYKVIIRNVKAGATHEELSKLLDEKMPRYVQHERPKRGEDNKWSIKFFEEEGAEKAKERLNGILFKGDKLQVLRCNVGPRKQMGSDASTTSETSSTITPGPTIIDGYVSS